MSSSQFAVLGDEYTTLIRTDFSDDPAWERVVQAVTAPADFGTSEDPGDQHDDGMYTPNIQTVADRSFDGATAESLAEASNGQALGYLLLADSRAMLEAAAGGELTVVYVDLSLTPLDAEEYGIERGRAFRCAVKEIASIEVNLSIANMDFDDFADGVGADGVFRGFPRTTQLVKDALPEQRPGRAASGAIDADLRRLGPASGEPRGTLDISDSLTGTRRKLFPLLARYCGLWGSNYSWSALGFNLAPGETLFVDSYDPEGEGGDPIAGPGYILLTYREIASPSTATVAWNWYTPRDGESHALRGHGRRVLDADSLVKFALTESKADDGNVTTLVQITHQGLPARWTDHMTAWWRWRLAIIEQSGVALR